MKVLFFLLSAQCFNYARKPTKSSENDQTIQYLHDKTKNQLSILKLSFSIKFQLNQMKRATKYSWLYTKFDPYEYGFQLATSKRRNKKN